MRNRLKYGDGAAPGSLAKELKTLWNEEFVPKTLKLGFEAISWDRLELVLYKAASKIKVNLVNGTAKDVLDYQEPGKFVSVIAIGGNKLSRGLTLEGLSISYYLRHSNMYDTLMQMGRWFGYRDGYLDLCRIFTPNSLISWYRHISHADAELREDFDDMVESGSDPKHYGHRVRSHPSGLLITALNKMRAGTPMKLSFAGKVKETTIFSRGDIDRNYERTVRFLEDCDSKGAPEERGRKYIWKNIPGDMVANYISLLQAHPDAITVRPELLSKFILAQLKDSQPN